MTNKHAFRISLKAARKVYVNAHKCTEFGEQFLNTFLHYVQDLQLELANKVIALYYPFGYEASSLAILEYLMDKHHNIALPKMDGERLVFCPYSRENLYKNSFGFYEPKSSEHIEPDIFIVPLLGFDCHGNRLGYGKGHYDRAFDLLSETKCPHVIGLAFPCQEIASLCFEPHDKKLDAVLLPHTYISFSRSVALVPDVVYT